MKLSDLQLIIARVHVSSVIFFVTLLHGFTPRLGVLVMNVCDMLLYSLANLILTVYSKALSVFKIVILVFVVITGSELMLSIHPLTFTCTAGWVVLSGHTRIQDPHANFRNAFAGSSHSSNDVSAWVDFGAGSD